ncbi:MAG: bifunctional YncE family protein/alkaline phosphatase family protein [Fimbriimonas sp.]|nr:bifunctional YncE family protein/alkaline phosphatase family protein [Fimbriimonas sp.]
MLSILLCCLSQGPGPSHRPFLHMPSVDSYAKHDPSGVTILPEGRFLTPAGKPTPVARWPYGLAVSPDGTRAFVASEGAGQWVNDWQTNPTVQKLDLSRGGKRGNSGGCALSADGKHLYWSTGEQGGVRVVDTATDSETDEISVNGPLADKTFADSYINDLAPSADGRYLYCADVANFRLAVIDLVSNKMVASTPTGRYPYALTVDGSRVFVANIGQFAYSPVGGTTDKNWDPRGLSYPPFAYPSKEAENGVDVEGRHIPGLGSPYAVEAFSVFGYDVANPVQPKLVTRTKTGSKIGSNASWGKVVGGSCPSYLLADGEFVFVSNSNDDTVEKIEASTGKIVGRISLEPSPLVHGYRGIEPTGLALSADKRRLFVCESGLNALAEIDVATNKVVGLIPTAWYPYRVAVSPDGGHLACICFKGYGNGPKGISNGPKDPFTFMRGTFHTIPTPDDRDLPGFTAKVLEDNGIVDASVDREKLKSPVWNSDPGKRSEQIKYVVFITKENHSFDTIFDRIPGSNNDPSLLQWGYDQTIAATGQPTLEHVAVMKNHNKLARQFVVSDNFYMEPEASGVGHRWLVGIQPNNFCQLLYTLGWNFKLNTPAAGRRASFGSNGSMAPEDYPEAGAMWEHLDRHGVKFRNYGEGFEFAGVGEDDREEQTGAREVINMPMPKSLYDNTCRDFPIFNMNIPDMFRAEWFAEDVEKKFIKGGEPFPSFVNIAICNDHGTGPNAKKGYPYRASWMADNDYALGTIVEFLSHTPYWKNMLILVTQDDAGGENDHIDAQRSVLLAISPWVRHGFVSHRHTTITSMHRTLYEIFGLPPLNLFDALSNDFSDCFTDKPDFTPYAAEKVDRRLFDWPKSRDPKDPFYVKARTMPTVQRDTYDPFGQN